MTDYTGQGLREAESRHNGHPGNEVLMQQYFEGRDKPAPYEPYIPPAKQDEKDQDTGLALRQSAKLAVRVSAVAFPVSGACGLYTVLASGALNAVLGYVVAGSAAVLLISGLFGASIGKSASSGPSASGGASQTINVTVNTAGGNVNVEKR